MTILLRRRRRRRAKKRTTYSFNKVEKIKTVRARSEKIFPGA